MLHAKIGVTKQIAPLWSFLPLINNGKCLNQWIVKHLTYFQWNDMHTYMNFKQFFCKSILKCSQCLLNWIPKSPIWTQCHDDFCKICTLDFYALKIVVSYQATHPSCTFFFVSNLTWIFFFFKIKLNFPCKNFCSSSF